MTAYVTTEADCTFACHLADGSLFEVGSDPVEAPDELVPYLDTVRFVKRVDAESGDDNGDDDAGDESDDEEVDV
jgi:hypothetical protein